MRQLYTYDANESTRRLVEDGMSTGLTNTLTARGYSILYHVIARKQCILFSALCHKSYLKTGLDGTIFAYDCRAQLACVMTFDHRHAHNFHLRRHPQVLYRCRGSILHDMIR